MEEIHIANNKIDKLLLSYKPDTANNLDNSGLLQECLERLQALEEQMVAVKEVIGGEWGDSLSVNGEQHCESVRQVNTEEVGEETSAKSFADRTETRRDRAPSEVALGNAIVEKEELLSKTPSVQVSSEGSQITFPDNLLRTFEVIGPIGVRLDEESGLVVEVSEEGSAKELGIDVGWTMYRIDKLPFSSSLVAKAISSSKPWEVTFLKGSGGHAASCRELQEGMATVQNAELQDLNQHDIADSAAEIGRIFAGYQNLFDDLSAVLNQRNIADLSAADKVSCGVELKQAEESLARAIDNLASAQAFNQQVAARINVAENGPCS